MVAERQSVTSVLDFRLIQLFSVLVISLLTFSCSGTKSSAINVKFPMDSNQPYLVLDQVVKSGLVPQKSMLKKLSRVAFGTSNRYQLDQPSDMALDGQGRLLIVDVEQGMIQRYRRGEKGGWEFEKQFKPQGLRHPMGIATGDGLVFISDLQSRSVFVMDENFRLLRTISDEAFSRPGDLCYDTYKQRILIVDPPTGRIFAYSPQGEKIAELGDAHSGPGKLQSPVSVTVDVDNGDIYVIDAISRKIKHYRTDFSFVSSFGKYDQVPGSFAFPKGIALGRDGVIFVSDAAFGNIQMFDPSGALLYFFGENGTEVGQFLLPRDLLMDEAQNLYVADPYNHRVQIFKYDAQP